MMSHAGRLVDSRYEMFPSTISELAVERMRLSIYLSHQDVASHYMSATKWNKTYVNCVLLTASCRVWDGTLLSHVQTG